MSVATLPERPRLVLFTDRTSGPCRRVDGFIAEVLQHRRNHLRVKLVAVDRADRPDLVDRFKIEQFPTLVVVHDNVAGPRISCPKGIREIEALLEPWLKRTPV